MVQVRTVGLRATRQRIRGIIANQRLIEEAVRLRIVEIWRDAALAFIRAAVRQTLVQTGMTAASFFPLGRTIQRIDAIRIISGHIKRRATSGPIRGEPRFPSGRRGGGFQDIDAGERLGEKAFRFNVPKSVKRLNMAFSFSTVVFQHAIHELPPQNRQSLAEGEIAFRAVVDVRLRKEIDFVITAWLRGRKPPTGLIVL